MKKVDEVTGEEFECSADETCWCMKEHHALSIQGNECIGPKRLKEEIQRNEHNIEDHKDIFGSQYDRGSGEGFAGSSPPIDRSCADRESAGDA